MLTDGLESCGLLGDKYKFLSAVWTLILAPIHKIHFNLTSILCCSAFALVESKAQMLVSFNAFLLIFSDCISRLVPNIFSNILENDAWTPPANCLSEVLIQKWLYCSVVFDMHQWTIAKQGGGWGERTADVFCTRSRPWSSQLHVWRLSSIRLMSPSSHCRHFFDFIHKQTNNSTSCEARCLQWEDFHLLLTKLLFFL